MAEENRKYSWQQVAVLGLGLSYFSLAGYGLYNVFHALLQTPKVVQENVLGNGKPETYIEVNGVKYYSHVDGKDISDLVKK
ncbi:MAG: hypothetical protein AABX31_02340 [Nanoarchaeota archaeon]|mgnify:CR=1 FL=1